MERGLVDPDAVGARELEYRVRQLLSVRYDQKYLDLLEAVLEGPKKTFSSCSSSNSRSPYDYVVLGRGSVLTDVSGFKDVHLNKRVRGARVDAT